MKFNNQAILKSVRQEDWVSLSSELGVLLSGDRAQDLPLLRHAMKDADPATFRRLFLTASLIDVRDPVPDQAPHAIHICVGFDNHFAPHGATTMMSAMVSAKPNTTYHFHVFEDPEKPLSEDVKASFHDMMALFDHAHQVHFKTFDMNLVPEFILKNAMRDRWPRIILLKMYIPEFYKDLDKIFWLDSDILVRTDLSAYWDRDFEENYLMGSRDLDADEHLPRLGLSKDIGYLNAGVILFNNTLIRKDAACRKIIQVFEDDTSFGDKIFAPEQDILAAAFQGKILEIDAQKNRANQWNYFYRENKNTRWPVIHDHFSKIVHIAARSRKPWNNPHRLYNWNTYPQKLDGMHSLYYALRDLTPWATHN